MLRLTNHKVFFIFFFLLVAYYFGGKLIYQSKSAYATGTVTHLFNEYHQRHPDEDKTNEPVIIFTRGNDTTFFRADDEYYYVIRAQVPVIYEVSDPDSACIYTLMGFWLRHWFYYVPVLLIMAALIYTTINSNEFIEINLKKMSLKKIKPEKKAKKKA